MKKPALLLLASALLITVAALALYTFLNRTDNGSGIKVSGNIEATTVETSFKIAGRVKERPVDEGENIKAGQLVALLDSADLAHDVAVRQAETDAARSMLAEQEAGSRKEEIGQAEAALAAAEAEAKRAADDFRRMEELFRREVIPKQKYDAARAATDGARANARLARESLSLARQGPRRERIDQARARLREAEALQALAKERFGYATLNAPVSGLVMSKHVEPGEQVAPGTPVITIGLLENVWVRAYIAETDLGKVNVGNKVRVTTDTWPGKTYDGRVSFIATEAEFTPKNVQTQKERVKLVYRIKVTLPNPHQELKPGMPADAVILTGTGDQDPGSGPKGPGTGKTSSIDPRTSNLPGPGTGK
jgi:HlyD family secretion protein